MMATEQPNDTLTYLRSLHPRVADIAGHFEISIEHMHRILKGTHPPNARMRAMARAARAGAPARPHPPNDPIYACVAEIEGTGHVQHMIRAPSVADAQARFIGAYKNRKITFGSIREQRRDHF